MESNLKYTMIFIKHDNALLLLNRIKPPNMGLWTGVGGKIEQNESPMNGAIREVFEETGIVVNELSFNGTVTWQTEQEDSGMYLYACEVEDTAGYDRPRITDEGIVAWQDIDWVLNTENKGIPRHLQLFLPSLLAGDVLEHRCTFHSGNLLKYEQIPLKGVPGQQKWRQLQYQPE